MIEVETEPVEDILDSEVLNDVRKKGEIGDAFRCKSRAFEACYSPHSYNSNLDLGLHSCWQQTRSI